MHVAIGVEYNGSHFHGWQTQQPGVRTVQEEVEKALAQVAGHDVRLACAGRTDTGVHGLGQVAHFETAVKREERSWVLGANSNLPSDISVLWAREVDDEFHARFSAVGRSYRYLILNRLSRSALLAGRATWVYRPLNAERMHQAGQQLVGTHDFTSFRAIGCQAKSPVRTLHSLTVKRYGDRIELRVHANAFLHHMVRNIAGVLIAIGKGDKPVEWVTEVLAVKDRTKGGVTAPPDGLYFEKVDYPEFYDLPDTGLAGYPLEFETK